MNAAAGYGSIVVAAEDGNNNKDNNSQFRLLCHFQYFL